MTQTLDPNCSNSSEDWNTSYFNSSRDPQYLLYPPSHYTQQNITYVDLYLHEPSVAVVFIVFYLLIFLVCMVGNGVVCFIVLRSKNMRTVTNIFILNLAISDLLVGIFCMPTTLVDNIITARGAGNPGLRDRLGGRLQGVRTRRGKHPALPQ
ncbi:unnamed protein product [Coregonus sp. 'balchen']|nr:unnamed protein product [Coregonus sp. 'balchen']